MLHLDCGSTQSLLRWVQWDESDAQTSSFCSFAPEWIYSPVMDATWCPESSVCLSARNTSSLTATMLDRCEWKSFKDIYLLLTFAYSTAFLPPQDVVGKRLLGPLELEAGLLFFFACYCSSWVEKSNSRDIEEYINVLKTCFLWLRSNSLLGQRLIQRKSTSSVCGRFQEHPQQLLLKGSQGAELGNLRRASYNRQHWVRWTRHPRFHVTWSLGGGGTNWINVLVVEKWHQNLWQWVESPRKSIPFYAHAISLCFPKKLHRKTGFNQSRPAFLKREILSLPS